MLFLERLFVLGKVGSMLTSTSSLGFPGGSLGCHETGWPGYVIVGLLGHNLDLIV